jgi:hypothetical protein
MHIENYDSPFHRVTESPTDRLIQETKKRYCGFLRDVLAQIKDIEIIEMSHPMMSCYISTLLKINIYQVRVNYDMDKKQFAEPRIMILNGALSTCDGYLFEKDDLGVKMITIFAKFYEVSQIAKCGTKYGGEWENTENANQMARKEYERLREEHRKIIIRKQEEIEERTSAFQKRRDDEFRRKMEETRKQEEA